MTVIDVSVDGGSTFNQILELFKVYNSKLLVEPLLDGVNLQFTSFIIQINKYTTQKKFVEMYQTKIIENNGVYEQNK